MVRISLFKSERVKRKYEQKKNLKWKTVLDTVKKNLSLIRIDQKKMQMLQEDNDEQKIQIRVQEEKITELNIKIDKSKKKLSDLKDENLSQEYVEYTKVLEQTTRWFVDPWWWCSLYRIYLKLTY